MKYPKELKQKVLSRMMAPGNERVSALAREFNGQGIEGLGRLNYEARRGMYLHPTYAVTVEREPLGVLDAWMWAREAADAPGDHVRIKERARWTEGYERVAELA